MRRRQSILIVAVVILAALLAGGAYLVYKLNLIPSKAYSSADFDIEQYRSAIDKDGDGIDDQTDIIKCAREYIATKPKYKSKYYESGYSDDEYGVCTDVVAMALLHSGYDLKELVSRDIENNGDDYEIEEADENIDFRRVRNLEVYFSHTAIKLTIDTKKIEEWQGGDIVIYKKHIGIVSDKRNRKGVPFLIHHGSPYQRRYEENTLEKYGDIVAHYRIS